MEGDDWETECKDMRAEADAIINDVVFAVRAMALSRTLPSSEYLAYINVETKEGQRYCVELSDMGLKIVSHAFDLVDDSFDGQPHETIYSLLDTVSPAYRQAFSAALFHRLEALQQEQQAQQADL
ncbi:GSK3B-interacting protein [Lethenteron reissneri]|uniref:GSK3B-interacting protein n=1 Tax=Lethenteron reissneri TaxID=7753 RepID=UPI002AB666BB|nr:GSK3B-interacting protein [Lethenteron reissneri]XP_061422489.1 GSK3B-interacting protein [Lethenteron reissneri]XP_061422490.1 GSK3B-interacting protein [Lethenteron reissneri]XP_061422491.1 GSK3B-interacting protein [Lethenteron reissneri]